MAYISKSTGKRLQESLHPNEPWGSPQEKLKSSSQDSNLLQFSQNHSLQEKENKKCAYTILHSFPRKINQSCLYFPGLLYMEMRNLKYYE